MVSCGTIFKDRRRLRVADKRCCLALCQCRMYRLSDTVESP
jgi:hypothetical protein